MRGSSSRTVRPASDNRSRERRERVRAAARAAVALERADVRRTLTRADALDRPAALAAVAPDGMADVAGVERAVVVARDQRPGGRSRRELVQVTRSRQRARAQVLVEVAYEP